jgi:probable F420-dependent oxidoreductase
VRRYEPIANRGSGVSPQLAVGLPSDAALLRDVSTTVDEWARLGYRSVWASEVAGPDFATTLGAIGVASRRYGGFELGVGVAPVQTRAPWLLAATGASLATISGKPFNLGVGASSELIVGDWSGRDASRPLTQVRETVEIIRQALRQERTDFQGRTACSRRYRLPWTPDAEVRVLIGSAGPRSLRQAGSIADGVVLNMISPEHVPQLLADVEAGRQACADAARPRPHAVVLAFCDVTDDEAAARERVRASYLSYIATRAYGDLLIRLGFADDVVRTRELFAARRRAEAAAALSPDLVDALVALGSPSTITARVRGFLEAGADTVVVCPDGDSQRDWFRTWEAAQKALG